MTAGRAPDVWLMPGMDGTGRLFAPLLSALTITPRVITYPPDVARYDELLEAIADPTEPTWLVAESFSGPLAVRLASRCTAIRGLVMVSSFVRGSRAPTIFGPLLDAALALRPPRIAVRVAMLGLDADDALVDLVRDAVSSVPARTFAGRLRDAARADVRAQFGALRIPIVWAHATADRLVPSQATREARAIRSDLDVRSIDGPHLLAQARPRKIAALIEAATS